VEHKGTGGRGVVTKGPPTRRSNSAGNWEKNPGKMKSRSRMNFIGRGRGRGTEGKSGEIYLVEAGWWVPSRPLNTPENFEIAPEWRDIKRNNL